MKKGFSLIEVLVLVTVLGLFFVAAASILTYSLRNMQFNEHKILATHYADEALEWVRSEKETDWQTFTGLDLSSGGATYCLNTLSWSGGPCATFGLASIFKREVILTDVPDSVPADQVDQVNVVINVYWDEGSAVESVSLNTVLNQLE